MYVYEHTNKHVIESLPGNVGAFSVCEKMITGVILEKY